MKKCENCKFYDSGICRVLMWVEGLRYGGTEADPDAVCELFEAEETQEAS